MVTPTRTKSEKRANAKAAAAARARAAKRRRQNRIALYSALAVVVLVGLGYLIFRPSHHSTAAKAKASTSASAAPTSSAAFPPVPAGADKALSTKPTVTAGTGTVTALKKTVLIDGTGAATKSGQNINVNYVGVTYANGKEFDSSWSRSQAFSFQLGAGKVIAGWDQGLVGVKIGSRVQLDIPSNLAYGDNASSGSPTGTLRFVVDVLAAS
jgi:peptidylprolyl isomerase